MPFKNIIQDITVSTTPNYSNNDTLFDMVEVQLPAKSCVLHGGFFVSPNDGWAANDECAIHFFQKNTHAPGAANEAFGLTAAQIEENGYLGGVQISQISFSGVVGLADVIEHYVLTALGNVRNHPSERRYLGNLVLKSVNPGNTIFMVGVADGLGTASAFFDTDKSYIQLSLEY
tara:strand:- start:4655 stop:5176 length:522 start_codon:yes stop_codon:yes gene_type:complete